MATKCSQERFQNGKEELESLAKKITFKSSIIPPSSTNKIRQKGKNKAAGKSSQKYSEHES